jgi:hypothetical protein
MPSVVVETANEIKKALRKSLEETLIRQPYNSVSQYLEYFADKVPDKKFGTSCVWQPLSAGRKFKMESGQQIDYLISGRHVAAVYNMDSELVVLDPYLVHAEPIILANDSSAKIVSAVVDALPLRTNVDARSNSQVSASTCALVGPSDECYEVDRVDQNLEEYRGARELGIHLHRVG